MTALAGYSSASAVQLGVTVHRRLWHELQGISPTTVCQSLKLLVASTCDLPDVTNCQFQEHAAATSGHVHFLSLDQQSGLQCLIICGIQLLTPNHLGETRRRICSLDIQGVSGALEVLQIDFYLPTYLLFQLPVHSSLKTTNCSIRHATPHLWNKFSSILFVFLISLMHHHHPPLLHSRAPMLDWLLKIQCFPLRS